jgi:hypothetical protein
MLGSIIATNSRRSVYENILSDLRHVMISKMVKPEEVRIAKMGTLFTYTSILGSDCRG